MEIFPAVDILGGKVVRLFKGDYSTAKNYPVSCVGAAKKFKEEGAKFLHAVDLDGAKSGRAENVKVVEEIIKSSGLFVEIGGGIRSFAQAESYISAGAGRIILGTAAVENFEFVKEMAEKFPQKVAVGVDAAGGKVAIKGWREITNIDAGDFCRRLADVGVENVIYTDISTDGAMRGTNLKAFESLVRIAGLKVTASGGITTLDEIRKLKEMGVYAAILGKALYENKLDLKETVAAAL